MTFWWASGTKTLGVSFTHELVKRQNFNHVESSQLICEANQLTGFYITATLALNELKLHHTKSYQGKKKCLNYYILFNAFHVTGLFPYPMKKLENIWKRPMTWTDLKSKYQLSPSRSSLTFWFLICYNSKIIWS